jgi:hypothetical protein
MTRSISEEGLSKPSAFHVESAQVTAVLNIGGDLSTAATVSKRITMEDLRKTVSRKLGGLCRVKPKEFPAKDGTEVVVIP